MTVRTLGGLRPGSIIVIDPANPTPRWMPCLRRQVVDGGERASGPHCWFLASSDWPSFHCPACYATIPHVIIVPKGHTLTHDELLVRAGFTPPSRPPHASAKSDVGSFEATPPIRSFTSHAEWVEEFTERSSIFEYLANVPRTLAEQMARALVGSALREDTLR